MDNSLATECAKTVMTSKIDRDHRMWKETVWDRYVQMTILRAPWPILSVEWLSEKLVNRDGDVVYSLLLGNSESESGCVLITKWTQVERTGTAVIDDVDLETTAAVPHPGGVNRARHMVQVPGVLATQSDTGAILIYNLRTSPQPLLTLSAQRLQGFGLDWNPILSGTLISGSYDHSVSLWDVQLASALNRTVLPLVQWTCPHPIEDVVWSPHSPYFFLAVDRTGTLTQFDSRRPKTGLQVSAHAGSALAVDFNRQEQSLIATSGTDKTVAVWDLRLPGVKLAVMKGHKDAVLQVKWAPFSRTVLASSSSDRLVHIWSVDDLSGKPRFTHDGHTSAVSDLSWNPHEPMLLSSVSDTSIHIWEVADSHF